jgi:hypothetical protein
MATTTIATATMKNPGEPECYRADVPEAQVARARRRSLRCRYSRGRDRELGPKFCRLLEFPVSCFSKTSLDRDVAPSSTARDSTRRWSRRLSDGTGQLANFVKSGKQTRST